MKKISFPITGMHCASCAANIQRGLQKLPGVTTASVNYASEEATAEYDESSCTEDQLANAVQELGYQAHIHSESSQDVVSKARAEEMHDLKKKLIVISFTKSIS
jgi:Cu+-exporting ATPase